MKNENLREDSLTERLSQRREMKLERTIEWEKKETVTEREREKEVSKFIPFLFELKDDGIARKKWRKNKFLSILGVDDRHGES